MNRYRSYRKACVKNDGMDGGAKEMVKELKKRSWVGEQGRFRAC